MYGARKVRVFLLLLMCLFLGASHVAAQTHDDDTARVSPELLKRFNQLVRRARSLENDGPGAVIKVYTEALVDPLYQAYGQIHLKLGTLLKDSGRRSDAAYHFKKCLQDHRVDKIDRSIICQAGFEDTTTTLELVDAPKRSKVVILEPTLFSGPFQSGNRLPLGRIRLVVEAPGHFPLETELSLEGPKRWIVELGMKRRRGPLVPDEFLVVQESGTDTNQRLGDKQLDEPPQIEASRSTVPYWIAGGIGLAIMTTGIIVGQQAVAEHQKSTGNTDKLRQQAITGDIVAWSGGSLAGGTLLWYFLTD